MPPKRNPHPQQARRMMRYGKLVNAPRWKTTPERIADMRDYCAKKEIDATQMIEDGVDLLIWLERNEIKIEVIK